MPGFAASISPNLGIFFFAEFFVEFPSQCISFSLYLFDYDQSHEADLYTTLKVVLEENGNLKAAAEKMYIHYDTMRSSQQKIESLLGRELSKMSSYQYAYIAVRIHEMFSPKGYGY
jgi:DNA-binding PucR family transcriptional regulator